MIAEPLLEQRRHADTRAHVVRVRHERDDVEAERECGRRVALLGLRKHVDRLVRVAAVRDDVGSLGRRTKPHAAADRDHDAALHARADLHVDLDTRAVVEEGNQRLVIRGDHDPAQQRICEVALAFAAHGHEPFRWNARRQLDLDEADLRAQLAELVLDALRATDRLDALSVRGDLGIRQLLRVQHALVRQRDLALALDRLRVAECRARRRSGGEAGLELCRGLVELARGQQHDAFFVQHAVRLAVGTHRMCGAGDDGDESKCECDAKHGFTEGIGYHRTSCRSCRS